MFSLITILFFIGIFKLILGGKKITQDHTFVTREYKKTYIDENGYYRFTNSNLLVHRWLAEKKIGRKLRYGEEVHHIDGRKWNNDSYNLFICNRDEHQNIHEENLRTYGSWYKPVPYQKTYHQ